MKEWLSNFWYHYKVHTIVVIFVIIIAVYTVVELSNRELPDLDIAVAGSDTLISKNLDQFESEIENLIQDANGDDKTICTINNVVLPGLEEEDTTLNSSFDLNRLVASVASGETKLFVVNYDMLEYLKNQYACQDITDVYEKMNIPHEGQQYYYKTSTKNPVLQSLQLTDESCYVFIRVRNSAIRDNEEQDIQYQNAYRVLEEIIKNDQQISE